MTDLIDPSLLARFVAIVGERNAIADPDDQAPYLTEWRDLYRGETPMVLRPGTAAEVSAILALADRSGVKIVPQGGNTGLVGGQIPAPGSGEIVLSLARLDKVRAVDPLGYTITVEAGVTLEAVQRAAEAAGRLFPLTLASQGTCSIGGNISSNAGGTAVLSYGNTRDLTLGLEVVLADGRIWNGLRGLRKDNAGYDLKQLFIGAEGTLGVVTAAVMRLHPLPRETAVAVVGLPSPRAALDLLSRARDAAGPMLTGFELIIGRGMAFVAAHLPGARVPIAGDHPWYVLVEISAPLADGTAGRAMEDLLASGLEQGIVTDAAVAASLAQADAFWALRHGLSEVQKHEGGSIKHDVSVPVGSIPDFLDEVIAALEAEFPGARPVPFGHMGDGNIHLNVSQPVGAGKAAFLSQWDAMNAVVHGIVARYGGSVAAEHGVGRLKVDLLAAVRDPVDLDLMRRIKTALDPNGTLNPGRVLALPR
ncbi:MAG TPA: FAD-binding oxidoreductase [Methylomirabilota bacterium]|nr:FAD-binding oxidoreductase [Methylomirabilota bacterium]